MFFTFLKLYKWYQIAQCTTLCNYEIHIRLSIDIMLSTIFFHKPFSRNKYFQVCLCLVLLLLFCCFSYLVTNTAATLNFIIDVDIVYSYTKPRCLWSASRVFSASRSCPRFFLLSSPEFELVIAI